MQQYGTDTIKWDEFKENGVPEILYKYRALTDKFQRMALFDQELWLAHPKSFEDKLDCKNPVRYDLLTKEQIYQKYLYECENEKPDFTRQQKRKWARDWTKKSPLYKKGDIQEVQETFFNNFSDRLGVLSLTANFENESMWKKYADDSQGICIGYDSKILFRKVGGGGIVQYYDELPTLLPTPFNSLDEHRVYQVYAKEKKWAFEEEYRCQRFSMTKLPLTDEERRIRLPKEAILEVIIGDKVSKNQLNEIEDYCKNYLPNCEVKRKPINK